MTLNISNTLAYGGGTGSQCVLLRSTNPPTVLGGWTRVQTTFATPGTLTVAAGF